VAKLVARSYPVNPQNSEMDSMIKEVATHSSPPKINITEKMNSRNLCFFNVNITENIVIMVHVVMAVSR
jgi:hypothetical protein